MRTLLLHAFALLVSAPLMVAGLHQLSQPFSFLNIIYSYNLVDTTTGVLLAAVLPSLQVVLALALLGDFRNRKPLFPLAGLLYLCGVLIQVAAWKRGLEIPGGWWGITFGQAIGPRTLVLPICGILGSVAGYSLAKPKMKWGAEIKEEVNPMVRPAG